MLTAVATDRSGAKFQSPPVEIGYSSTIPPLPVVEIVSPQNGAMLSAPATFIFGAEVLASVSGDAGPVEFFLGTNSLGQVDGGATLQATTPPSSLVVSNLPSGEYKLSVRYRGGDGRFCFSCDLLTNTIRVVNLGIRPPTITGDHRLQFEAVTSFPGRQTITQSSLDLRDWFPFATNYPSSNSFPFIDPFPATNAQRYYRLFLPPEGL